MITKHDVFLKENKFSIYACTNTQTDLHMHNYLELGYVTKGEAIHSRDGQNMLIKSGDYFVIDYNCQHSYVAKTDEFEVINCIFLPEFIDSALTHCRSFLEVISNYQIRFSHNLFIENPSVKIYKDEDGKIKTLLTSLLDEFSSRAAGYMQIIRSMVIELLVLTMRKIYFEPNQGFRDSFCDRVLMYIHSNYMNAITLNDIAKSLNYCPTYLSAKFKKDFGVSFSKYLQKTRIEQSMRLLAHTNKSIDEISAEVGYRDIKTFYTLFKTFTNTSPAKFRKNHSQYNKSPELY